MCLSECVLDGRMCVWQCICVYDVCVFVCVFGSVSVKVHVCVCV